MTNYHQQGLNRDKLLCDILRDWGALDTDQIVLAVPFPSKRVANRRLAKLLDLKRIKRSTYTLPYCYYIDLPVDLIDRLNRNWVRLWVMRNLRAWESLVYWDYNSYRIRDAANNKVIEYTLTDKPFKLLDDKVVIVESDFIDKIKEELKKCVR